jgi:hypothetical protein
MNVSEAMERIEGHAFSAMVNLASDFPTFLRILTARPEVRTLAEEMKSERVTLDVFARIGELAASPIEEEYEHLRIRPLLPTCGCSAPGTAITRREPSRRSWSASSVGGHGRWPNTSAVRKSRKSVRKLYRSIKVLDTLIARYGCASEKL